MSVGWVWNWGWVCVLYLGCKHLVGRVDDIRELSGIRRLDEGDNALLDHHIPKLRLAEHYPDVLLIDPAS